MNQNALLAIVASAGIVVGAGGTWLISSNSTSESSAIAKADIQAAIKSDPSLCPVPQVDDKESSIEFPSQADALAAVRKLEEKNPMIWDRNELKNLSVSLSSCKSSGGNNDAVECITNVKKSPSAQPIARMVEYVRDQTTGDWIAINSR